MIEQLNINTFLFLNHFVNKAAWFDDLAIISAEYLPLVFIALLVYLWFANKRDGRNSALYAGYSALIGLSLNFIITLFYFHPRPFMNNLGTALMVHAPETSFPSDHTTFMLSIAVTLLLLKGTRKMGMLLIVLATTGGLSRVVCGIHYPLDLVGSLMVALVSSAFIVTFKGNLAKLNQYIIGLYGRILNQKPDA